MKTKRQYVKGPVSVWAIPKSSWERVEGEDAFRYVIKDSTPWESGAVKVCTQEVELVVPAGIDLLARAVETLQEKQRAVLAEAHRQNTEYEEQIKRLLMIGHDKPEVKEVEGVLVDPDDPF